MAKPTYPHPWPRLSEDLGLYEKHPGICQNCGVTAGTDRRKIIIWQEHDDRDQPEPIAVPLCEPCSEALIDDHPRLYSRTDVVHGQPFPGVMPVCVDCPHRAGLKCTHPKLKINGGPGLVLTFPPPVTAHIDGRDAKTGKRFGRWERFYRGPVSCEAVTAKEPPCPETSPSSPPASSSPPSSPARVSSEPGTTTTTTCSRSLNP